MIIFWTCQWCLYPRLWIYHHASFGYRYPRSACHHVSVSNDVISSLSQGYYPFNSFPLDQYYAIYIKYNQFKNVKFITSKPTQSHIEICLCLRKPWHFCSISNCYFSIREFSSYRGIHLSNWIQSTSMQGYQYKYEMIRAQDFSWPPLSN